MRMVYRKYTENDENFFWKEIGEAAGLVMVLPILVESRREEKIERKWRTTIRAGEEEIF